MSLHAITVRSGLLAAGAGLLLAGLPAMALAQSDLGATTSTGSLADQRPAALTLSTTYPAIITTPGNEATFPLSVEGPIDERVDLGVAKVPDGFDVSFRGGDENVSSVFTSGTADPPLELRVRVPDGAAAGTTDMVISASSASGEATLPIDVVVAGEDSGNVSLTASYPVLSGDSASTFDFDLKLRNDTPRDIVFGLQGSGPDGWTVDVRPSSSDKASTALVNAGASTNIKVSATPSRFAAAGRYLLDIVAEGEGETADAQLGVEVTGSYELGLDTVDGRLNDSVAAGESGPVDLVVTNSGTAPLTNVALSAKTPTGWDVTFVPDTVASVDPASAVQVQAQVTPAGNAVAGDYALTISAAAAEARDDLQLRTTVETSSWWGAAAIAIIAVALGGLFLVFRRYGRR